jgi:hypothetical protein
VDQEDGAVVPYPSAVLDAKRVHMKQGEVAASPSATLAIERRR